MKKLTRRSFIGLAAASVGAAVTAGCDTDAGSGTGGGCPDVMDRADMMTSCIAPGDLPVMAETEVLVVGGGPGGLAAAISAGQAGAETMLVERYGFYGGVITQAIMGSITWYRYAQTVDAGGVCAEIEARAKAMGGSINLLEIVEDPGLRALMAAAAEEAGLMVDGEPTYEILRSELFKAVADSLVVDAGVTPLLHCWVVGAVMDGETIKGVVTESKSGRQVILAFPGGFTAEGHVLSLNAVHMYGIDSTDVWDLTRAEIEGRRRVLMAMEVLRQRVPGFADAQLSMIGPSLGCRESRKVTGRYHITGEDVRNEARFEDAIGIFPEFVDGYGILCLPTTGRYFQVPYGITLPQVVENLLVVGRCVAGDRVSHGATRQMACCMVTGQGAGVAAAVSLNQNTTCREVDMARVQNVLVEQGVRIA